MQKQSGRRGTRSYVDSSFSLSLFFLFLLEALAHLFLTVLRGIFPVWIVLPFLRFSMYIIAQSLLNQCAHRVPLCCLPAWDSEWTWDWVYLSPCRLQEPSWWRAEEQPPDCSQEHRRGLRMTSRVPVKAEIKDYWKRKTFFSSFSISFFALWTLQVPKMTTWWVGFVHVTALPEFGQLPTSQVNVIIVITPLQTFFFGTLTAWALVAIFLLLALAKMLIALASIGKMATNAHCSH